jgi:uncharacterized protein with PIN domain
MNERARFLAISYEKCPYCERKFWKKKKHFVNDKVMKKLLDSWFNAENS